MEAPKRLVYLDNAATTRTDPAVISEMSHFMAECFGNPSSVHSAGREAKVRIEEARRQVAYLFNVRTSELFFTSGGTESLVTALRGAIVGLGLRRIVTSQAEHLAVLRTLEQLNLIYDLEIHFVELDRKGRHDLGHLDSLLNGQRRSLVCLMHANNVIGNLLPVEEVGQICKKHNAVFLCDTVQTVGKYLVDPHTAGIHMAACSAHKLHGPKGIGFLFVDKNISLEPLIYGGGQERGLRSGTENTTGIIGLHKALDLALTNLGAHREYIASVKQYAVAQLKASFDDAQFIADSDREGLYNMINVSFKEVERAGMLQFNLDMAGIAISTGSACSSGATKPSHVLKAIKSCQGRKAVRISFSKYSTREDVDALVAALKKYLG